VKERVFLGQAELLDFTAVLKRIHLITHAEESRD
jgi:hypothetical protein